MYVDNDTSHWLMTIVEKVQRFTKTSSYNESHRFTAKGSRGASSNSGEVLIIFVFFNDFSKFWGSLALLRKDS